MSSASERAAHRRATWRGGVVRSFAEAEEADLDFWANASPDDRMEAMTQLLFEAATLGSDREAPPWRFMAGHG